ncbi:MAG: diguanylate cyclase, partial [Acidimicrobiia bacterium]
MLSGRNSTSAEGAAPEAARHGPRTVADLAELAVLAIDRSPIAQFVADLDGRVVHANDAYCHLVGVDPDQVVGSTAADVLLASDVDQVVERVQAALDAQADPEADVDVSLELRLRRADGTVRTCDATICTGRDSAGTRWLTVHLVDVTALRQAHETTTRLARIAETTSDLVALLDGTGEVVYLNRAARRTHGLGQVTPGNLNILDFFTSDAARRVTEEVLPQLRQGRPWEGELDMRRGDGSAIHVWQTMTPEMDPAGDLQLVSVVGRDITEQKRVEAELAHQATHDSLTQLPNRAKILDHLDVELTQSRRTGRSIAVLFIDLDRFKSVNDRFGHEAGDELLRATAQRIGQVLRPTDVVGRLGGDEFVVLCAEVSDDAQARTIAERILHRLEAEPVSIAGGSVSISASIGIATSSGCREAHPEAMLREADAAMYLAKQRGRG